MLVLKRKQNQTILVGNDIEITIVNVRDGVVKLGFIAPANVKILRKELTANHQDPERIESEAA